RPAVKAHAFGVLDQSIRQKLEMHGRRRLAGDEEIAKARGGLFVRAGDPGADRFDGGAREGGHRTCFKRARNGRGASNPMRRCAPISRPLESRKTIVGTPMMLYCFVRLCTAGSAALVRSALIRTNRPSSPATSRSLNVFVSSSLQGRHQSA